MYTTFFTCDTFVYKFCIRNANECISRFTGERDTAVSLRSRRVAPDKTVLVSETTTRPRSLPSATSLESI